VSILTQLAIDAVTEIVNSERGWLTTAPVTAVTVYQNSWLSWSSMIETLGGPVGLTTTHLTTTFPLLLGVLAFLVGYSLMSVLQSRLGIIIHVRRPTRCCCKFN
jgi:hypothetical protein